MKNFKAFYMLVCILFCSCAFCPDLCHGSQNILKPSVYGTALKTSVKRYAVYPYKKDKILCEPYRVSKGDWLYKIFRKKGDISENDFPLFINMFKAMNPGINNIDAIHPGQLILIPLKKIHKNDFKEISPGVVDVPVIEFTNIPEELKPFIKRHKVKKGEALSRLLDTVFLNKDGTLNNKGMYAFKLANPNIKNINLIYAGSFINLPLASLCLQPWFKSSSPVTTSVATSMQVSSRDKENKGKKSNGKINKDKVNKGKEKTVKIPGKKQKEKTAGKQDTIIKGKYSLSRIIEEYSSMVGGKPLQTGKFYFPRGNNADLILDLKSTPVIKLASGKKILVVPDKKTATAVSGIISSFWKDLKVLTVVRAAKNLNRHNPALTDKQLRDHVIVDTREKRLNTVAEKKFLPADHEAAIKDLIGFTDFHYIPNSLISLSQGNVHFNVSLGRIQKKGRTDLLVDFGTIYGDAFDIIRRKGFKIISFPPKDTLKTSIVKLFTYLDMSVTKNPVFVSTKTKKAITIHGLYVTGNIKKMLIAEQHIDKETTDFLNQKNIKLLYLQDNNSKESIKIK